MLHNKMAPWQKISHSFLFYVYIFILTKGNSIKGKHFKIIAMHPGKFNSNLKISMRHPRVSPYAIFKTFIMV